MAPKRREAPVPAPVCKRPSSASIAARRGRAQAAAYAAIKCPKDYVVSKDAAHGQYAPPDMASSPVCAVLLRTPCHVLHNAIVKCMANNTDELWFPVREPPARQLIEVSPQKQPEPVYMFAPMSEQVDLGSGATPLTEATCMCDVAWRCSITEFTSITADTAVGSSCMHMCTAEEMQDTGFVTPHPIPLYM